MVLIVESDGAAITALWSVVAPRKLVHVARWLEQARPAVLTVPRHAVQPRGSSSPGRGNLAVTDS
jgi:hypothetical protein